MSLTSATNPSQQSTEPIQEQIRCVMSGLCTALSKLLDQFPMAIEKAADLERALRIDSPLAWRVFRIARAVDPAEAVEHLPTVNQLRRAVAQSSGIAPPGAFEAATAAVERLGDIMTSLGGDQRGFESLVSALSPGGVRRVELQHRRSAFRANVHLWGMHVRCLSLMVIIHPNPKTGEIDGYFVHGYHDVRPTRPGVPMILRSRLKAETQRPDPAGAPQPAVSHETDFLESFSTLPRPALAVSAVKDGFVETRIGFRGISPADAETIMLGRYVQRAFDISEEVCDLKMIVTWPCEMLHADVFMPTGLTDPSAPAVELYTCRDDPRQAFELRREDRAAFHEQVKTFTGVERPPPSAAYPHMREIFDDAMARHGWGGQGAKYDLYRVQVPYPMMHGLVRLVIRPSRAGAGK
jgi:hypothetical protein